MHIVEVLQKQRLGDYHNIYNDNNYIPYCYKNVHLQNSWLVGLSGQFDNHDYYNHQYNDDGNDYYYYYIYNLPHSRMVRMQRSHYYYNNFISDFNYTLRSATAGWLRSKYTCNQRINEPSLGLT